MPDKEGSDYVVPVIQEELHADAIPVESGSVRVVKRVEGHDEILEQELRKGRVEVKRVKTERVVSGPQQPERRGNTLIIPVVSEVLRVEKQWVVTEEIHITQLEEKERFQQTVTVNREVADVERLDESGRKVSSLEDNAGNQTAVLGREPAPVAKETPEGRRPLSQTQSIIKPK
jgi:stress response protein YsnF